MMGARILLWWRVDDEALLKTASRHPSANGIRWHSRILNVHNIHVMMYTRIIKPHIFMTRSNTNIFTPIPLPPPPRKARFGQALYYYIYNIIYIRVYQIRDSRTRRRAAFDWAGSKRQVKYFRKGIPIASEGFRAPAAMTRWRPTIGGGGGAEYLVAVYISDPDKTLVYCITRPR